MSLHTAPQSNRFDGPRGVATSGETHPSSADIQTALAQARDLKAWWARVEAGNEKVECFELFPAGPGSEPVWGFFGEAPVQGKDVPVMAEVADDFFDQPRVPPAKQRQAARWMLAQVEEFALHYWLRSQASALPEPYPELGHGEPAPFLSWLSLCFPAAQEFSGSRNLQQLFKLLAGGRVGMFPLPVRTAIIDLRELETTYEWITLNTTSFNFNITIGGAHDESPSFVVPLTTTVHCVTSAELIVNRQGPEPGTLGAFGPGLGLISAANPGVLTVAPDMIQPGLRLQSLRVLETGEVRWRGVAIMPRPRQIVSFSLLSPDLLLGAVDAMTLGTARRVTQPLKQALANLPLPDVGFDPVLGSIRLLNLLTGNRAASELCISQEQVEKEILAKEAQAMRQGALGSRQVWLRVPDWLDSAAIPNWVVRGEIA
jgi:hypothetical protein